MATFLVIITGVMVFSATQVSPKQNYIAERLGLQKKTKKKKTKTKQIRQHSFSLDHNYYFLICDCCIGCVIFH